MNRERAKELLPIIQAFAEGKKIESTFLGRIGWSDDFYPTWADNYMYRIKSEPKYRPFKDADECWEEMHKHQPFGWVTFFNNTDMRYRAFVCTVYDGVVDVCGKPLCTFESAFINFTFEDGTPFGKLEE